MQHARHQLAPLAVHRAGQEGRRQAGGDRSGADAHRKACRLAYSDPPRHRCGAGAGDDSRHHQGEPGRPRLHRQAHRRLRRTGGAGVDLHPRVRRPGDRHSGRGHRQAGTGIRHHAAGGGAHRRRRGAPRRWRSDRARDRLSPGTDRRLEACGRWPAATADLGLSGEMGGADAARPAAGKDAGAEFMAAWAGADRRTRLRSADQGPVRLQRQPHGDGDRAGQTRTGSRTRGPVHGGQRTFPDRHGRIRRHRFAGDHPAGTERHHVLVGASLSVLQQPGDRAARRSGVKHRAVPSPGESHGHRGPVLLPDR